MQDFFSILSNFGFPVAVASYLLFRFEKKLEELSRTNMKLVEEIDSLKTLNRGLLKDIKLVQKKVNQLQKIIINLKTKI